MVGGLTLNIKDKKINRIPLLLSDPQLDRLKFLMFQSGYENRSDFIRDKVLTDRAEEEVPEKEDLTMKMIVDLRRQLYVNMKLNAAVLFELTKNKEEVAGYVKKLEDEAKILY